MQHDAGVERRRLSARTSRAGWTVAASGNRTPRRKTGEIPGSTATARAGTPSSAATRIASSTAASWAGVVETSSIPPRRSHTSSPSASTAGIAPSDARARTSAASSPSRERSRGSAHQ